MEFRLACDCDIENLMNIFKVSFNETEKNLQYFFNHKFKKTKCVVCIVNNEIVSSINMFDTNLVGQNGLEKAIYIYGAATHPKHRNNGYMRKLINYSNTLALNNGYNYSILLPAKETLYDYYKKLGYLKFFKTRFLNINESEIVNYINNDFNVNKLLTFDDMSDLRYNICRKYLGFAMWNTDDIKYAVNMNSQYGGSTILSDEGYAICYIDQNSTLQVIEFMVTEKDFKNLLTAIYKRYPDINYRFRLPLFNNYFNKPGEIKYFGMIKPLNDKFENDIINESLCPYLGLTLD